MRGLGRNVVLLGVVSFFADVSSDMVMPLLPAFLVSLGAGAAYLGVIEGAAEATAALLKYLSGRWADKVQRLLPLHGFVLQPRLRIRVAMTLEGVRDGTFKFTGVQARYSLNGVEYVQTVLNGVGAISSKSGDSLTHCATNCPRRMCS